MDKILRRLREVKVFTVVELAAWLSCAVPTARCRLKEWGAHTSYNLNSRYYALPDVTRFDANGLWRCRGAFFSRHGTLRETVRAVTVASEAGLTSVEIGAIVGLDPKTFLSHFKADPGLSRESCGGRAYVWFAGDEATRLRQMEARRRLKGTAAEISDADAVRLLVEVIKKPGLDCAALAQRLGPSTPRITAEMVEWFLRERGLLQKKTGSPPSRR